MGHLITESAGAACDCHVPQNDERYAVVAPANVAEAAN